MSRIDFIPLNVNGGFPKGSEQRRARILNVISEDSPIENERRISGLGAEAHKVYEVDIDDLIYNFQNYRFFLERATYENQKGESFYTTESNRFDAARITEEKIWNQDKSENEKTISSLLMDGQIEPAVCDMAGVVVSGNRRLTLLHQIKRRREAGWYKNSKISQSRFDELSKIRIVILRHTMSVGEIESYETRLQHNESGKLDYDRTAKYFIVRNLLHNHHKTPEVIYAENQNMPSLGKVKDVDKFVRVADLMDEYLTFIKLPKMYTQLEGTEDPLRFLDDHLRAIADGKISRIGNRDAQISEYKTTYFTALRAAKLLSSKDSGSPGEKWYRSMLTAFENNSRGWNDLSKLSMSATVGDSMPEKIDDVSIREHQQDWKEKHGRNVAVGIADAVEDVRDYKKYSEKPEKLLEKARDALEQFDKMLSTDDAQIYLESIENPTGLIDDIRMKANSILNRLPVD